MTFKLGEDETKTAWGVSVTGGLIFNGVSGEGVDPFYPVDYKGASTTPESVDGCLGHPEPFFGMFHYHTASPCMVNQQASPEASMKQVDLLDYIAAGFEG